ncbi:amino acid ABC transporter [Sulfurospirillum sp. T05]|uniref:Amino acid ABC transporter n=1 Tax=Sulfurospirillum tamanense TaxID=2813362 RepID=A0ABS2WUX9_9BACT|nr:HD domain-containing phosphohydrolase [Sulfurospirillum tamanensis]MBN2965459.1 amino acid ABC transporter [Sulfurospirillum tamanensis]
MKKPTRFTFTFGLLSLFVGLASFLSLSLIGHNYKQSTKNAYAMIQKRNANARQNVIDSLNTYLKNTSATLSVLTHALEEKPLFYANDVFMRTLWEMLLSNDKIASIYLADTLGNFVQARRDPRLALRVINLNEENPNDRWLLKDRQFNTLDTQEAAVNYDPRTRIWFQKAWENRGFYWSEPYPFASTDKYGITVALADTSSLHAKVAGVDFTIESIAHLLQEQSQTVEGPIVLFNETGHIIATSLRLGHVPHTFNELGSVAFLASYESFKKGVLQGKILDDLGVPYLFAFSEFSSDFGLKWYIGTYLQEHKVTQEASQIALETATISLTILLLIILVTWFVLRRIIIRPVDELKTMSDSVAAKRYNAVRPIKTRIKEFHQLSHSMVHMARAIKQHDKEQETLMEAFIHLIAGAIDEKSPYTGGHCHRVPELSLMLAKAADASTEGIFATFGFPNEAAWREFRMSALLHDCGKVTTPEYVVDKATKLETIYNRIHEIRTRFEVLLRDAHIAYLEGCLEGKEEAEVLRQRRDEAQRKLYEDFAFLAECNIGGEFMEDAHIERLRTIAAITWTRHFDDRLGLSNAESLRLKNFSPCPLPCQETLLSDKPEHRIPRDRPIDQKRYDELGIKMEVPTYFNNQGELYNLSIRKGTLNDEERYKINEHIIMSIRMLSTLPLMDNLKKIPEYAGGHHETMIGTGYPRKLTKKELSLPARIIAVADIFEALTANDRPYKKAKTLSESIRILSLMAKDQHIDADIFRLFLSSGVYAQYAKLYLNPEQIDTVDISQYL